jgi:hypothetical protein
MSLVQHVSAIDGIDRELEPDLVEDYDFAPIRRKISYDVIQPSDAIPVAETRPGTPAYKHSSTKRIGLCSSAQCKTNC